MRLALLGATGRTGRQLVDQALAAGHDVRALVRRPTALDVTHARLVVLAGDALDADAVDRLVGGADAVVATLGGGTTADPGRARSVGVRHAAAAMQRHGVARLLAVAGGGILDAPEGVLRSERAAFPAVFRLMSAEHRAAWDAVRDTALAWTLACAPDIVDGPRTGVYRVLPDVMPEGGRRIATGDLADFLLRELADGRFLRRRVGIAY